jgi:histone H3/H4
MTGVVVRMAHNPVSRVRSSAAEAYYTDILRGASRFTEFRGKKTLMPIDVKMLVESLVPMPMR